MTAAELRAARAALGLSAQRLALALDADRPPNPRTIRRWEAGDRAIPDWVPRRLARLLAVHPRSEPSAPPPRRPGRRPRAGQ